MKRRDLLNGLSLAPVSLATARAQSVLGVSAVPVSPAPPAPNPQAAKLDDTVGSGFNRIVIARWGDAVLPDAPAFDPIR